MGVRDALPQRYCGRFARPSLCLPKKMKEPQEEAATKPACPPATQAESLRMRCCAGISDLKFEI
jgi:hypothetical protein